MTQRDDPTDHPSDSRFQPTASRPASLWPESTRSGDLGSSVFGSTGFDAGVTAQRAPLSVFDVCHVGVVLRALLFVHAVVAVGVLFVASGFSSWMMLFAAGSGVALPGVLLWLLVACACKRPLARLTGAAAPLLAAMALGAVSGLAGFGLTWLSGTSGVDSPEPGRWLAPALAGAGMAGAMYLWLRLRAKAQVPADTTAQLAELQSRIRPHFLFNTLNTALSLVRHDPLRAEGVLEDLAELFRVALTETGEAVTLDEEVELARRYLAIEQIRFGKRLRIAWEIDPDAGGAKVPPLLLQPLVENAVRHGVEPAAEGGMIRIRTQVRLGRAVVSIANTVSDADGNPGHGIALANVRERLRLMHDVASQFDAQLERGVFRVQIVVPL